MQEKHHRKIVSIIEQRHKRRYVWLAHALLLFIIVSNVFFNWFYRLFPTPQSDHVANAWLVIIIVHFIYVIVKDRRGRLLIAQIESRYGWDDFEDEEDAIAEKRKRLYTGDDGELRDDELVEWQVEAEKANYQ